MPIPYPEAFRRGRPAVVAPEWDLKRMVSMQVVCFNWLSLGSPRAAPDDLALGNRLTAKQWTTVKYLEHILVDANSPSEVDSTLMGRAFAKFDAGDKSIAALARAAATLCSEENKYFAGGLSKPDASNEFLASKIGCSVGRIEKAQDITAKPIIAKRLVFPGPPSFDPSKFLDAGTRRLYDHPIRYGLSPEACEEEPPKVRVFASRREMILLYKALADSGRLQPISSGQKRGNYVSGLFSVHKDATRDRLVLDSRPANLLDKKQNFWCKAMAAPGSLASIYLEENQVLLMGGEDLRDFFYQFKSTPERTVRNVLSDPITAQEAQVVFGKEFEPSDELVWVGLSSLAMGDTMACEFAQSAHVGVLLQGKAVHPNEIITLKDPLPRGLLRIGIIIDDLVVLETCLRSQLQLHFDEVVPSQGNVRILRSREAYDAAGLERNPKKGFIDQLQARFWGVEVDGDKGMIRAASTRLWPAIMITLRVASLGLATVGLLESLAGTWISLLSPRRRMLCLMDTIFGALTIVDQSTVVRLSQNLIDELIMLAVLGPLAVVDLRAPYHNSLIFTDASMHGMASVEAPMTMPLASELCRTALVKGRWSRLLDPADARLKALGWEIADEVDEPYTTHPLWQMCATGLQFHEVWRQRVINQQHINVLEVKAYLREERRLAEQASRKRVAFGLDSQVGLGALVKGSSSSLPLNAAMRRNLAYPIGGGLFPFYLYVPSKHNRADAPSRDAEVEGPDAELPWWFLESQESFYPNLDIWLAGLGAAQECELPFEWLMGDEASDIRPAAQVRRSKASTAEGLGVGIDRRTCQFDRCYRKSLLHLAPDAKGSLAEERQGFSEVTEAKVGEKKSKAAMSEEASIFEELENCFARKQFFFRKDVKSCKEPGGLDLFSGNFGVAKMMIKHGAPWVLTFEWKRSQKEDLRQKELKQMLLSFVKRGAFKTFGLAPICASFSRAITPAIRSRRWPKGIPGASPKMKIKIAEGNAHGDFCRDIIDEALAADLAFWCENPDKSFLWMQERWADAVKPDSQSVFRLAYCRFGTPWQKNTRVLTNTLLAGLRMMCECCGQPHQQLRGYSIKHGKSWTAVAEPYPRGFAKMLAVSLCIKAGWCRESALNVAGCARTRSLRIGEALNPGPRRTAGLARPSLTALPLMTPATLALEARVLQSFVDWCREGLRSSPCDLVFDAAPEILAFLLQVYGDLMFQNRKALSNYRHLLLAAQRWKPLCRPYLQRAWEFVSRWEAQEPVEHRIPIPEPLVRAICVMAWARRWYAWCAATLVAFYGGGRLGEILQCTREDVLLPMDFIERGPAPVFVRLRSFKSKNRQSAKVQHLRLVETTACSILHLLVRKQPSEFLIFNTTHYQYRKRWNFLLGHLKLPSTLRLTPGGLRGGFAVWAYRNRMPVQDIMWSMRLRSQVTLESYLQETAALNCFAGLSKQTRSYVDALATMFPFLPAAA
eukprot:Skav225717  [mRNA]  locus=scaffold164:107677:112050:+ [translate_table: standard]